MENVIDLSYVIGALKRRWALIVIPAVLGTIAAVAVAFSLEPTFRSTARILVETQQIPSELARSTVTAAAAERIQVIEQRLTARQNLLDIAGLFDLFSETSELSATERVDAMRRATRIESQGVRVGRGEAITGIDISFDWSSPTVAARVANELLTRLVEQNVEQRTAVASETLDFFTAEVDRLSAELDAIEERISDFKRENANALPEGLGFRRAELERLESQRFARESRRIALEEQKRQLEQAIEIGTAAPGEDGASPERQELRRLRLVLAQQRGVLADSHPTIRSLNARITSLEESVIEDAAGAREGGAADQQGRAAELLAQVEATERELALIESQDEAADARIRALRDSIARTPLVETQLAALERDLETARARRQNAVLKQAEAATGERLEVNQQAERFEILEQPQVSNTPISPNRRLIVAAGVVGSIGLGVLLAGGIEFLNQALRSPKDLEMTLGLRPIVTVPYIWTERERASQKWSTRVIVFAILIGVPAAVLAIDQLYLPLSVLAERVVGRLGL